MNIVTPIPNSFGYPTSNVGTDSARRDNVQREIIPSLTQGEKSAADKGVGAEADRNNQSNNLANLLQNPTYDKPTINQALNNPNGGDANKDNASDQSAGREGAESEQEKRQQQSEDKKIEELKDRDTEVRLHEQAHAATGGQYAGAPTYEYETGPDGKRYAVGGEVSIDIAEAKTPEETVRKMQQVKAAALAPAEPSPQDYKVAAEASQKEQAARADIAKENVEALTGDGSKANVIGNLSKEKDASDFSDIPTEAAGQSRASLKVENANSEISEQSKAATQVLNSVYSQRPSTSNFSLFA
jgi:hypothetical protein